MESDRIEGPETPKGRPDDPYAQAKRELAESHKSPEGPPVTSTVPEEPGETTGGAGKTQKNPEPPPGENPTVPEEKPGDANPTTPDTTAVDAPPPSTTTGETPSDLSALEKLAADLKEEANKKKVVGIKSLEREADRKAD